MAAGMRRGVRRPLRVAFVAALMVLFLALRVATSQPPVSIDDMNSPVGSRSAHQSNLPMTLMGVCLIVTMVAAEPAMAFGFILCDMSGFGAFLDLDQWGISGAFKFRDLEMGILLAASAVFWLMRPLRMPERRTRLGTYLVRVSLILTAIGVVYTLTTLRFQDLGTTVRYSRQLYVWLLLPVAAQFVRTPRDLSRVIGFLIALVALSAGLYVAQALTPPQTVLRYSQQMITGGQTRVWATSLPVIFLGGLAIFAYQLQPRPSRAILWTIFAACSVAIVMSQGRMLTAMFAASIGMMVLHRAIVTHRIRIAVRVAATAAAILVACTAVLWAADRLDPFLDLWNRRIGELSADVHQHEGTWSSRMDMFAYLPLVVERNGGGPLASTFGMGLRALTPAELAPMVFWGTISPPIWADNGLAGVTFTFGYFGLFVLVAFVTATFWRLRVQFARSADPLCRAVTFAAVLYFAFALPYMFFSAAFLGAWDDALAVVVLLSLVERSAAVRFQSKVEA